MEAHVLVSIARVSKSLVAADGLARIGFYVGMRRTVKLQLNRAPIAFIATNDRASERFALTMPTQMHLEVFFCLKCLATSFHWTDEWPFRRMGFFVHP